MAIEVLADGSRSAQAATLALACVPLLRAFLELDPGGVWAIQLAVNIVTNATPGFENRSAVDIARHLRSQILDFVPEANEEHADVLIKELPGHRAVLSLVPRAMVAGYLLGIGRKDLMISVSRLVETSIPVMLDMDLADPDPALLAVDILDA